MLSWIRQNSGKRVRRLHRVRRKSSKSKSKMSSDNSDQELTIQVNKDNETKSPGGSGEAKGKTKKEGEVKAHDHAGEYDHGNLTGKDQGQDDKTVKTKKGSTTTEPYSDVDGEVSLRKTGKVSIKGKGKGVGKKSGKQVGKKAQMEQQLEEARLQAQFQNMLLEAERKAWSAKEKKLKLELRKKRSPKVTSSKAKSSRKPSKKVRTLSEVDKINKLLGIHALQVSDSEANVEDSTSSDDTSASSDSDSDSEIEETESYRHRKKASKKGKSGIQAKASSKVINQQQYAHSALQSEFVNIEVEFNSISFPKLVAGELEIITSSSVKSQEKQGRLNLLKSLAYHRASDADMSIVRGIYAAVLRRIELGQATWASDFSLFQHQVYVAKLAEIQRAKATQPRRQAGKKSSEFRKKEGRTYFCRPYQRNVCDFLESPHPGEIKGVEVQVHHICARCYLKDREVLQHPETSSACPHFGEQ